ncbi:hypothetical protein VPHK379_0084 [Vibrio phage K379]
MRVILETPFKSEDGQIFFENIVYANMVARYLTVNMSYSPLFFHTFYTQFLDDNLESERELGLKASFEHHEQIGTRVIAIDRGISKGMKLGAEHGLESGCMPLLFSISKDRGLQKAIGYINKIPCPIKRWEQIEDFCEGWKPVGDTGELTSYVEDRQELREEVLGIMESMLIPLVDCL